MARLFWSSPLFAGRCNENLQSAKGLHNTIEKEYPEELVIEQIIKFELRGLGPLSRVCALQLINFHEKANI